MTPTTVYVKSKDDPLDQDHKQGRVLIKYLISVEQARAPPNGHTRRTYWSVGFRWKTISLRNQTENRSMNMISGDITNIWDAVT